VVFAGLVMRRVILALRHLLPLILLSPFSAHFVPSAYNKNASSIS
jgi:hypothetical protein